MLILSLDTTTRTSSCALVRNGAVVCETAIDPSTQVAVQMPGVLKTLIDGAGVTLREIDAFAVATGPGSFTGLRIGIAAMQGLAFAEGKPLIGISALDALASIAGGGPDKARPAHDDVSQGEAARTLPGPRIATWVDAWRGDVYAALYVDGHADAPVVAKPEHLLSDIGAMHVDVLFIGEGAQTYRGQIVSALGDAARIADPAAPLLAGRIATLAADAYAAGDHPPPHAIRPLYVRRPEVEIQREAVAGRLPSTALRPGKPACGQ